MSRETLLEMLRCCEAWEPNVCIMGNVRSADAANALRAALAEAEAPNPWKEAVHDALIINWAFTGEHENDPRKAVADLIAQEVRIALDPAVSSDAQALIDRGKAEARKANPMQCEHCGIQFEDKQPGSLCPKCYREVTKVESMELSDEEILALWQPPLEGAVQRPILGKNKILAFARAVLAHGRKGCANTD